MNLEQFAEKFLKLVISKKGSPDVATTRIYYEILGKKPYISETLERACLVTWYQDYNQTVSRMPDASELLELNNQIQKENYKQENNYTYIVEEKPKVESSYIKSKQENYGKILFKFCYCATLFLGYKSHSVWDYLEKNDIEIKPDFPQERNEFIHYAREILNSDSVEKLSYKSPLIQSFVHEQ